VAHLTSQPDGKSRYERCIDQLKAVVSGKVTDKRQENSRVVARNALKEATFLYNLHTEVTSKYAWEEVALTTLSRERIRTFFQSACGYR
jgi:hypothetical protein